MSGERPVPGSTRDLAAWSLEGDARTAVIETVAVEEPLGIRVVVERGGRVERHDLAVTMRTPGHDRELALGFLVSEGVVTGGGEVARVLECDDAEPPGAVVEVTLAPGSGYDPERFRRNVYTTSSCGICGRAAVDRVRLECEALDPSRPSLPTGSLWSLSETLRQAQAVFDRTGGLHAAGWFAPDGSLRLLREDVGRHNAVDKVVGALLEKGALPADDGLLMVSGRASFELVQKAALAGMPILAAVGAPSSLAVDLAREVGMTLVGFLRGLRANVYCGESRLSLPEP